MGWKVTFHDDFAEEVLKFDKKTRIELFATISLLRKLGPELGRPHADSLKGSRYRNMKELRFKVGNAVWRVAFAFDPKRRAILLAAGIKQGRNERRFYERLISTAEKRYAEHLDEL